MTLTLYRLTAGEVLWSEREVLLVLAPTENDARNCLTTGSDSLWVSVATCEEMGTLQITPEAFDEFLRLTGWYTNAGGFVVG